MIASPSPRTPPSMAPFACSRSSTRMLGIHQGARMDQQDIHLLPPRREAPQAFFHHHKFGWLAFLHPFDQDPILEDKGRGRGVVARPVEQHLQPGSIV